MTILQMYNFSQMMFNDSKTLHNNSSLHNSVYLGAFVLEGYIKILLIANGATTYRGNGNDSYGGHLNDNRFIRRVESLNPELFSNSVLNSSHEKFPQYLLSDEYNINYRYEVDKWVDDDYCQRVQEEIDIINQELNILRIDGVIR